jgi:hypothetical protein
MPATVVLDLRARVYKRLLRYVTSPLGARLRAARRGLNGIRFGRRFIGNEDETLAVAVALEQVAPDVLPDLLEAIRQARLKRADEGSRAQSVYTLPAFCQEWVANNPSKRWLRRASTMSSSPVARISVARLVRGA